MKSRTITPLYTTIEEKINWGSILVDIVILICSVYTMNYWLLLLLFFTGSHKLRKDIR